MNKAVNFIEYFKKDKKRLIVLVAALIGIIVLLFSFSDTEKEEETETLAEYKKDLEEELSELCSSVRGAGKCKVSVSFSEGEHITYKGSNVTAVTPPKVLGVTVVCEGGDDAAVREAISDCMTSLFDIGANRVCVLKMKR